MMMYDFQKNAHYSKVQQDGDCESNNRCCMQSMTALDISAVTHGGN